MNEESRKEGKKGFAKGRNRIKSCFGKKSGRRGVNGALQPTLCNKIVMMRMTATGIPEH